MLLKKAFPPILLSVLCASGVGRATPQAEEASDLETRVKAIFLYNFVKFVEWPPEAHSASNAPYVIGVLGRDPFGATLDSIVEGETVNGRRLVIKRYGNVEAVEHCHLLFICNSESARLPQILQSLKGKSILTVGDAEQFTRLGGIIRFMLVDGRVRFEINIDAAKRAGLKLSSDLLKLAKIVRE